MRVRQLELLVGLSAYPTLTAAADGLGLTQPALSQVLAEIEEALGAQLFRRGRRLEATAILEPVLGYARRVLADGERLAGEIRTIGSGWAGRVRVGAMLVAAASLVPAATTILRDAGSRLEIELHEDIGAGLWPRLERGEIDLLVGRLDGRARGRDIAFEILRPDPHVVVARPGHPLGERTQPDFAAAADFPWILPPQGTALRQALDETFVSAGTPPLRIWLESASFTANVAILRKTDCLAAVSSEAARFAEELGLLTRLSLQLVRDIGPVGLAWKGSEPALPVREMREALRRATQDAC